MAAAAATAATTATTTNRNRVTLRTRNKNPTDFSKVGGLANHIELLREIIIFPLLYGDVYKRLDVKAPRGVLFFGPPGTGKTLVAGALATELNREGNGKVMFYQRKGADILDKWVGESERKLRDIFSQATRNRPSVIFFDELDGLAPVRSQKNDQVHCSVVATLLALMDGLDNMPGVIVIGATNRIDAIDPALRRPGRFDRELYFPLPSISARKEILEVHTKSWKPALSKEFLSRLAELTSGCCGSDLQALCAESVLCCLKRLYPNIHGPSRGCKLEIDVDTIVVEEIDFLNARMSLVPTSQRLGNYKVRKLSPFIKPLLQRQVDNILHEIQILLPQFTQPFKKFLIGSERYAGRLVIKGNKRQGLSVHIIPAILQALEHIPCYMLDIPSLFESNIHSARQNLPSILVLLRVDDWWNLIDSNTQLSLTAMLEDLHAGLPLLLIATCSTELPLMLRRYFYGNSCIVIKMEDPTVEEREQFFAPLFFGNSELNVSRVLKDSSCAEKMLEVKKEPELQSEQCKRVTRRRKKDNDEKEAVMCSENSQAFKRQKIQDTYENDCAKRARPAQKKTTCKNARKCKNCHQNLLNDEVMEEALREHDHQGAPLYSGMYPPHVFAFKGKSNESNSVCVLDKNLESSTSYYNTAAIKLEPLSHMSLTEHNPFYDNYYCWQYTTADPEMADVVSMWKRTAHITSDCLPVGQLEMLYDTIAACLSVHKYSYNDLMQALDETLTNFSNLSNGDGLDNGDTD